MRFCLNLRAAPGCHLTAPPGFGQTPPGLSALNHLARSMDQLGSKHHAKAYGLNQSVSMVAGTTATGMTLVVTGRDMVHDCSTVLPGQ